MKKILTVLILFVSLQSSYAQWIREWSVGYAFSDPTGKMKQNINQAHGVVMDFHMVSPSGKYALGADLNYSIYGLDQSTQEYTFPDGTKADMDINVTNSFMNIMASGRYNLLTGKILTPYVGMKVGYSFFSTDLNIYDPDDFDSCKPIESDILQKDGTWIYSLGGGVLYDLSTVFKRLKKGAMSINLSAFYTQGGAVNYMNTDAPDMNHTSSPPNRSSDLEAEFINTQTQVIHKHHIGYVYTSFAQMMDYRVTFLFRKVKRNHKE